MTALENNVTATNQVVESTETEDGITLMDLFRIVRKHILWGIIAFVAVFAALCASTFCGASSRSWRYSPQCAHTHS